MAKIQFSRGSFFVIVPKSLVKAKKWEKGTEVAFAFNERGNVELQAV
jgi:hypothetical protein